MHEEQQAVTEKLTTDKIDSLIKAILLNPREACHLFTHEMLSEIINKVTKLTQDQSLLLELYAPIKVVGSVHGHLEGLIKLFNMCGYPGDVNYLFLGNYIDKGPHSFQTLILLMLYRLRLPTRFFLLRGSHESASMNQIYSFHEECIRKSSVFTWRSLAHFFNVMPLAAILEGKAFCVHSGITPSLASLKQIRKLEIADISREGGVACELLWSEPSTYHYGYESIVKGVGYSYGGDAVIRFLSAHGLEMIIRSQELLEDGYEVRMGRRIINLFSAPDLMGKYGNSAAVLLFTQNLQVEFEVFRPNKKKGVFQKQQLPKSKNQ